MGWALENPLADLGDRLVSIITLHGGPCSSSKTNMVNKNSVWQETFCLSILSLNLITQARAFQTFGCMFLEFQLVFSDIFILEYLVGDGG